jgi:hypothetical protein
MVTYPGFQALPKGLKQMLLASESFFFDQTKLHPNDIRNDEQTIAILSHIARRQGPPLPFHPSWRN